MNAFKLTRS